ncbi:DUF4332 domain-containing protein [Haloferula chungangensis]|uniref:DUF4332 domain-containing protein n=1 Tax=Haloferula chungangensis TaxID=1048331 RepID=A0ABW2L759_9BACT
MQTLESIKVINPENRELLEAAGWVDPRQLALASAKGVHAELVKANGILKLAEVAPTLEAVGQWISDARSLTGVEPEESEEESGTLELHGEWEAGPTGPVNYEEDPEVQEMLDQAPIAIPLPNQLLAEKGISPSEIAIAPVLNRAETDLEIRVNSKERLQASPSSNSTPKVRQKGVVKVADPNRNLSDAARKALDVSRVRTMEQSEVEPDPSQTEQRRQTRDERLTLLRTTREKTNRGKKPGTRRYIRGVLHDRPFQVWFGCLIVILFQITVPLSIVAAVLLMITEHSPTKLEWVPKWIIAFPLALPILGILYFAISFGVKCRVCGQKVLVHRHCRKNSKAHHIHGLGYVLPLAVQTLLFRWFNCTFCGTSIRIKE